MDHLSLVVPVLSDQKSHLPLQPMMKHEPSKGEGSQRTNERTDLESKTNTAVGFIFLLFGEWGIGQPSKVPTFSPYSETARRRIVHTAGTARQPLLCSIQRFALLGWTGGLEWPPKNLPRPDKDQVVFGRESRHRRNVFLLTGIYGTRIPGLVKPNYWTFLFYHARRYTTHDGVFPLGTSGLQGRALE